jgi:hypothetical protein
MGCRSGWLSGGISKRQHMALWGLVQAGTRECRDLQRFAQVEPFVRD